MKKRETSTQDANNKNNSKKAVIIIVSISIVAFLLLAILGPYIIDKLYIQGKIKPQYYTEFSASDMLSYYGVIISAIIAGVGVFVSVWVLKTTIQFTRKQISHDRYLQTESDRLKTIESQFDSLISMMNPLILNCMFLDSLPTSSGFRSGQDFNTYVIKSVIELDKLSFDTQINADTEFKELLDSLKTIKDKEYQVSQAYQNILTQIETQIQNSKTPNYAYTLNDAQRELFQSNSDILTAVHNTEYATLLSRKNIIFTNKYKAIEEEADKKIR